MTFEVPSRFLSAFIKMADACRHIDTTAARRRRVRAETGCVAAVLQEQVHAALAQVGRITGKSFGDGDNRSSCDGGRRSSSPQRCQDATRKHTGRAVSNRLSI
jgi:hypothetical protein